MAHSPKISRSYRITDEVDRQVKELAQRFKKSEGEVVGLAVAGLFGTNAEGDFRAEVNRWFRETWTRLDEILETVQSVPETPSEYAASFNEPARVGFDPASIPGVQRGAVGVVIERYRCEHCGRAPAVPRVGDVCQGCRERGHHGEPRDCRLCAVDYGTGAL